MIYVDHLIKWPWNLIPDDVKSFGQLWCHLWAEADQEEQLHAMAMAIGLKREWYQEHPILDHYDIAPIHRERAIERGAIITRMQDYLKNRREIMAKVITLKYAGHCADCGAHLPVGSRAKWYGRGRVYGLDCHSKNGKSWTVNMNGYHPGEPEAPTKSRFDRYGVYNGNGERIGSTCGCEDYPCCGH